MTTVYPAGVDTFSTKVDRGIVYHTYLNDYQDSIVALETYNRAVRVFNVKSAEFGAKGDGSTDDVTAINAAIAAANATAVPYQYGGVVYFPFGTYPVSGTLTTPTRGVTLLGEQSSRVGAGTSPSTIRLTSTSVPMFSMGTNVGDGCAIRRLGLFGVGGTNLANYCIYAANLRDFVLEDCYFYNFGGSALRLDAGANIFIQRNLFTSSLLGYGSLGALAGVIELGAGEVWADYNNVNGVATIGSHSGYGSGYMCALYIKGSGNIQHWSHNVFAAAQRGAYVDSTGYHEFSFNRFEFNQAQGLALLDDACRIISNRFQDNSQDTDNTYDHMTYSGNACSILGNQFESVLYPTYKARYGINYTGTGNTGFITANHFAENFNTGGCKTALYNTSGTLCATFGGNQKTQPLTGTGNQTFDGQQGDIWFLTVNANIATTVKTTLLLPGHDYTLIILNSAGAAPAITLDTNFKVGSYAAPANTKYRVITLNCYDGTNLIGLSSGDI